MSRDEWTLEGEAEARAAETPSPPPAGPWLLNPAHSPVLAGDRSPLQTTGDRAFELGYTVVLMLGSGLFLLGAGVGLQDCLLTGDLTRLPLVAGCLPLAGLALWLLSRQGRELRKRAALLRRGQVVPGQLSQVRCRLDEASGTTGGSVHWLFVGYTFTGPDQIARSGQACEIREDLRGHPPPVGTPVAVLWAGGEDHQLL